MILFTADIDWAPEEVVLDTIQLFEKYNVCCTFFATHDSKVLKNCSEKLFEIGLHPNFNNLVYGKGGSADRILSELKDLYPTAKGIRSHSLTQSGVLLNKFKEIGMLYELNHFLPYHQDLKPFVLWNGLVRIPFNWEDDYHFALNYTFDESQINLNDPHLNIFNFHPIHIYLNSENNERFLKIKNNQENINFINKHINKSNILGTRDLLISLLEYVNKHKIITFKMIDVYNNKSIYK
jgi:hypothetical protein